MRDRDRHILATAGTNDGVWDWHLAEGDLWLSERWYDMLGYRPDELSPTIHSWQQLVHPEEQAAFAAAISQQMAGRGGDLDVETRMRTKPGDWIWVHHRGRIVASGPRGEPIRLVGTSSDINSRKASEHRWKFLFSLYSDLRRQGDPTAIIEVATSALGRHLAVAQVGFGEIDAGQSQLTVYRDWTDGRIPSIVGTRPLDTFGQALIADLKKGETLVIADVGDDKRTSSPDTLEAYARISTRALLTVPLVRADKLIAVLLIHHPEPRRWTPGEVEMVEAICERLWDAVAHERTLAALRVSEARLRLAQQAAGIGVWEYDARSGTTRLSSQAIASLGGQDPTDHLFADPSAWRSLIHPEDHVRVGEAFGEDRPSTAVFDVTVRSHPNMGQSRWIRAIGRPQFDDGGHATGMIGVTIDVTAQKLGELALARDRELLQTLIDSIPIMIVLVDPEGDGLKVNRTFMDLVGWAPTDLDAGFDMLKACYPDEARRARVRNFMASGHGWMDVPMETHTGATIETSWCNVRLKDGRTVGIGIDIGLRKQREEQLRRYRQLIETSSDFIGFADIGGTTIFANESARRLTGGDADDAAAGTSILDVVRSEDRDFVATHVLPRIRNGNPWQGELSIPDVSSGRLLPVWATCFPIRNEAGEVTALATIARDMTELKAQQARLEEAEERLRLAALATNDAIWDWDVERDTLTWSDAIQSILRMPGSDIAQTGAWKVSRIHPADQERVVAGLEAVLAGQGTAWADEYRLLRADGTSAHVIDRGTVIRGASGKAVRMVGAVFDATERDEAARRVRDSEARLDAIVSTAAVAIIVINEEGDIESFNEAAERIFGQGLAEVGGRPFRSLFADAASADALWAELVSSCQRPDVAGRVIEGRRRDGSRFPIDLSLAEWRDGAGRLFHTAIMRDISERKRAEAELARAQGDLLRVSRLSAMGAMASTLAHELNQPLTSSSNYLSAIRLQLHRLPADVAEGMEDAVGEAIQEIQRAGEIIRRMRSFAIEGQVARKPDNLADVIQLACTSLASRMAAAGVVVVQDFHDKMIPVDIDRTQIEQVISNILRNAMEAMADVAVKTIHVTTTIHDEAVELRIRDSGPGLSADLQNELFEPFRSTKDQGMGLGLPLCRTIIEAHGGRIWAEQAPEPGACFVMTFPAGRARVLDGARLSKSG